MENLIKYREKLVDHKLETEKEYQKVIISISGGALIVSLTFSDSLASLTNPIFDIVLIIGWLLLLLTVVLQLAYYRKVANSSKELLDKLDIAINEQKPSDDIFSTYKKKMAELDSLNRISVFMMSFGLLFISIFFSVSILTKSPSLPKGISAPKDYSNGGINETEIKEIPFIKIENNPVFINNVNSDSSKKECIKKKNKLNPCP